MSIMSWPRGHAAWQWSLWAVRAATAAGLAIDAYVHLHLAGLYAEAGGTINEGVLFRIEAAVALLAAFAEGTAFLTALAGVVITGLAARRPPAKTGSGPPRQQ